jgi:signal peptidase I
MKLIHTADGIHYRRWVNLIPSILLPGSAQFLAGRRMAGIVWFLGFQAVSLAMVAFLIHPKSRFSVVEMGPFEWLPFTMMVATAIDGFRHPIRRLHLKGWARFICLWFCLTILLPLGVRAFLVQPFKVPSGGMNPTILGNRKTAEGNQIPGDNLLVNKLSYRLSAPQRGDVVVFRTKGLETVQADTFFVQRLVGMPGETIRIDPPYVTVDGVRLIDPPIFQEISERQNGFTGYCLAYGTLPMDAYLTSPTNAITLGSEEYLVLGDNSPNSKDGRYFGPIKRKAILGKAFYIYAPADRKGRIR